MQYLEHLPIAYRLPTLSINLPRGVDWNATQQEIEWYAIDI
jgi:hypothetical protein